MPAEAQAAFILRGRNPDVLTCIANLSNDEVFTPPEFANRMLDTLADAWATDNHGANIWADKTVTFLDPSTKSGVFLREITSRLTKGLAKEIPKLDDRVAHILAKQVFGIGITQLTSLLARRSLYCSKHANGSHSIARGFASDAGNIWFERTEHTWQDGKCTYCGAGLKTFDRGEEAETHAYLPNSADHLKTGTRPPFPYSDVRLLPYLQHSFWFLPNVAACHAMANLLGEKHNTFWHDYDVVVAAGTAAGIGLDALPPVRKAIGSGFENKTIALSCGKLTTGVTVPQWSSILMLRNLKSPETYFQAAFRVQSPWSIKNPNGDDPNEEEVLKPVCFVFDFAPTRALRQLSEYGIGLSPNEPNPENSVRDLVSFLPVLAYDGANMMQVDAGGILDIAMAGTSATLLARKWESALLVNVDNDTLRRIMDNPEAMAAVERIEGWRSLGDNIIETIINKSDKVKNLKNKAKVDGLGEREKAELTSEEKEYKSKRKLVQEKLIKFATRIPAFMYLTDFRENTLQDVITKLEPDLFLTVTGLTVNDFHLLVRLKVFNTEQMNQAVFAFRRYEDASLRYTGIESHEGLTHFGLYDTVVARE
ncbi:MAG: hypothetical protein ABL866_04185 [Devosia sp.]